MGNQSSEGANSQQLFRVAITDKPTGPSQRELEEYARLLLRIYKKKKATTS